MKQNAKICAIGETECNETGSHNLRRTKNRSEAMVTREMREDREREQREERDREKRERVNNLKRRIRNIDT